MQRKMREFKWNFCDFGSRYLHVFYSYAEDFGHTDLLTIDVEIGDSVPVSQKQYNLPLKHTD